MSQKILLSKLLAVFMVLNILLVSFISVPVVLADPNLDDYGQTSDSIQKNETITLWAEWSLLPDPPINATLMTNRTGGWEAYKTIAPGDDGWGLLGVDTDFTLTSDDLYNWSSGPIGWYIITYDSSKRIFIISMSSSVRSSNLTSIPSGLRLTTVPLTIKWSSSSSPTVKLIKTSWPTWKDSPVSINTPSRLILRTKLL